MGIAINLLTASGVKRALERFMSDYDEFHWAVAWGSFPDHGQALLRHEAKLRNVIFGVAFSHTDPALIKALVRVRNAYVVPEFPGGTFHPKVYCFVSGQRAAAIVGSANFTNGGLSKNREAALVIEGNAKDPIFVKLLAFVSECASRYGEPVTIEYAEAYRVRHLRDRSLQKPKRDPIDSSDRKAIKRAISDVVGMPWPEYVRRVRTSKHHPTEQCLKLLRIARSWFSSAPSFAALDEPQRRAIAGIIPESKKTTPELALQWGWFGSMTGQGGFVKLVRRNDTHLARAIDSIPLLGDVTKANYDQFVAGFRRAFQTAPHKGGVATASRLLTLKRPDTFLCVCGPNERRVGAGMGFAYSSLRLENYWERVVETVRLAEWYNAPRPAIRNREIWDNRVALLDALYYEQK